MSSLSGKDMPGANTEDKCVRCRALDCRDQERLRANLFPGENLANQITYTGIAECHALATDPAWYICRVTYDSNGLIQRIDHLPWVKWSERTTLEFPGDGTRASATITYLNPAIPVSFNIFENDLYPEDYGWNPETPVPQMLSMMAGWINGCFPSTAIATVTGSILTIKIQAIGAAGNNYMLYSSDPVAAPVSTFAGGTDPEVA